MTRLKKSSPWSWSGLTVAWLVAMATLPACGPKVPPPPPEFGTETRVPTGDNRIEVRIVKVMRLENTDQEQMSRLELLVSRDKATDEQLTDYLSILIQRGQLGAALNLLHKRAVSALGDDSKIADALGLAMGQRRWGACAQMASDYLKRKHVPGIFLVRGLCLSRSEAGTAARNDYRSGAQLLAMEPETLKEIIELTEQRSGSDGIAPADEDVYKRLMTAMMQRGVLDRLFVQHLLGRFETNLAVGSLNFGSLSNGDIRQVILSRARSYRQCYSMARAERPWRPALKGNVTIEFLVNSLGRASNIQVAEDGWQGHHASEFLNSCISRQMEALRFPMPRYAMGHRSQHRFMFSN